MDYRNYCVQKSLENRKDILGVLPYPHAPTQLCYN
jgi:hypothetical protein